MPLEKILLVIVVVINIFAFFVVAKDKRKSTALHNPDRVPEAILFFLATIGGSIGVYTAMLLLRHKTRKWYFQIGIPVLILQNTVTLHVIFKLIP
jgi:uncharacterized membrane protein YsdA (DUF1294 family)